MHDTIIIHVPVRNEFVKQTGSLYSIVGEVAHYGVRAVSDVRFDIDENKIVTVGELKHPFESLPSSFDGMAMKFYSHRVANTRPYVALNASYKFIQGHNVFGGDEIVHLVAEMFTTLKNFYPYLYAFLDIENASISRIDCTYSAQLSNPDLVQPALRFLSNISNGHRKSDKDKRDFYNTVYYGGRTSNWGNAVIYGKGSELSDIVKNLQKRAKLGCTQSAKKLTIFTPELQAFSNTLLRFEARSKRRTLEKLLIPTNVWQFIRYQQQHPNVLRTLWQYWFKPVFDAMKGKVMTTEVDDSNVRQLCRDKLFTVTKSGRVSYTKAENAFAFYELLKKNGWVAMKERYKDNPRTFNINVKSLVDVGIPRAHLQNLKQDIGKEVPLIRLINMDFNAQSPVSYQPAISVHVDDFYSLIYPTAPLPLRLIA